MKKVLFVLFTSLISVHAAERLNSLNEYLLSNPTASQNTIAKELQKRIDAGADIDAQTSQANNTPLMTAILLRHESVAKYLIDRGADVIVQNTEGKTARMLADEFAMTDVVKMIDARLAQSRKSRQTRQPMEGLLAPGIA